MMKLKFIIGYVFVVLLAACEKENEEFVLEGTYLGTLSFSETLKSSPLSSSEGTAVVTEKNSEEISVHCFGGELDTTIMLNFFWHNDSVMLCGAGETFEHGYGHHSGNEDMMGHHTGSGLTSWQHHFTNNHQNGDYHWGGFHQGNHTLNFAIELPHGYCRFNGEKNK